MTIVRTFTQTESKASLRWQVLVALVQLVRARVQVACVPFSAWRAGLGQSAGIRAPMVDPADLVRARSWARRVMRAAARLPGTSKCLPQSMALQYLLRREGIASRLVIAVEKAELSDNRSFHAWVEVSGEMLIGQCERARYSSVASFDQFG